MRYIEYRKNRHIYLKKLLRNWCRKVNNTFLGILCNNYSNFYKTHIVASHGNWVRLLLPPYRGCLSVLDLDSMNILCHYLTNQIACWQNSSWYSEATLIQWNDTFYKSFGLNDKRRYERWRIFTMSSMTHIFETEQLSDIQFDTINNLLKGKSIQTGGG